MAENLIPLATLADLTNSHVAFDDDEQALVMLERASAAIRDAAGSLINVRFPRVPADIVSLTCSLAAAGLAAAEGGYDPQRGLSYERFGDYQYGKTSGDGELLDPFQLPERTCRRLRKRFGSASPVSEAKA